MATFELLRHAREISVRLIEDLGQADRVCIAVASADATALDALPLLSFVERGGELLLVAGTSGYSTDLYTLGRLSQKNNARARLYHAPFGTAFRPCLYVIDKGRRRSVYIGSSDLSTGGLLRDVVISMRIEGDASERELEQPMRLFEELFWSELALPIAKEFEDEYQKLRAERKNAQSTAPNPRAEANLYASTTERLAEHRGRVAPKRHFLVVSPKNYALCIQTQSFGRKKQAELERYGKGDPFFIHITGQGRGLRAMGMFIGDAYKDDSITFRAMDGGAQPFRKKFVILAELSKEIKTRPILESRRPSAPKHWFNGFVQASHSLAIDDYNALRHAFFQALATEQKNHIGQT